MDRRILALGSIIAVAILLGVSFTSVVGYSSNNSKSVKASPLYNIRSNRAIENGEDVTTCDYVGKGKGYTIPLPNLESRIALIKQILGEIKKIDNKKLNLLKTLVNRFNIFNNVNDDLLYTKSPSQGDCCTIQYGGENCWVPSINFVNICTIIYIPLLILFAIGILLLPFLMILTASLCHLFFPTSIIDFLNCGW